MAPSIQSLLIGPDRPRTVRPRLALAALGLFAISFAAYALDVFFVSGGVVWIPFHGALIGVLAALAVGYLRGGLVFAWLVTYAAELGYHADHAFLGLPRRTFVEQFAYFLRPDGLVFIGVQAVVLGSIAFGVGALVRRVVRLVRTDAPSVLDG